MHFRGEEWLPSAPVHLFVEIFRMGSRYAAMGAPATDLKPDGNGKLSKRDGDRLGFPVCDGLDRSQPMKPP